MRRDTIEKQLKERIRKSRRLVFLRQDFENIGGYDQVGRALRHLVKEGRLARISQGVYAKTRPNRITGRVMLAAPGGFDQVSKEALARLNVKWVPAKLEEDYQNGSTQIPTKTVVRVEGPFNRTIAFGKYKLSVEATI